MTAELFSLLVLGCVYGNTNSCATSGNAVYVTTPGPQYVEYINKEYKEFAFSAGALAVAHERRLTTNIGYNFTTTLDWKKDLKVEFIRWETSF